MHTSLATMLDSLGINPKPRFTVEEVGEILGIRRDQVIDLLKRKKLIGMKSSVSRWSGVFAHDLAIYIEEVNAPKAAPVTAPLPAIPPLAVAPVVSTQPLAQRLASPCPTQNLEPVIGGMLTASAPLRRDLGL